MFLAQCKQGHSSQDISNYLCLIIHKYIDICSISIYLTNTLNQTQNIVFQAIHGVVINCYIYTEICVCISEIISNNHFFLFELFNRIEFEQLNSSKSLIII